MVAQEQTGMACGVKAAIAIVALSAIVLLMLASCSAAQKQESTSSQATASASQQSGSSQEASSAAAESKTPTVENLSLIEDTDFGGVLFDIAIEDFNKYGFDYGDSVDIVFSNGYELIGIPYYNGYYSEMGDPLLVGYPGNSHIKATINYGDSLWKTAGVSEDDTATITLNEAGACSLVQEAFSISYTDERNDYESDEQFANFRELAGGSILHGIAYRSASPIDNAHNRVPYAEKFMEQASVKYVLDLADSSDEVDGFAVEDAEQDIDVSYFMDLRDAGNVGMLDLSVSYSSDDFAQKLAAGLIEMSEHEGPYLVHCLEGKDRTGFVCALLEALCGATYDEMLDDYMITYQNYYGITRESDPDKYDVIADLNLNGMLQYLAGVDDDADLSAIDYSGYARDYLVNGGMTDEQVDALVQRLTA